MGNPTLTNRQTSRLRQVVLVCVGLLALYVFVLMPDESLDSSRTVLDAFPDRTREGGKKLSDEVLNNRFLTVEQCGATFPGLTKQLDDAVAKGPFKLEKSSDLGPLVARVKNGKLSILQYARRSDLSQDMLEHRLATLHQIHSALTSAPSPSEIPDTIFAFTHHDNPRAQAFSYSRPADPHYGTTATSPQQPAYFPIPHFAHWAWASPLIGSLPRAADAISALEASPSTGSWASKDGRAVWRGTPHFNSASTATGRTRQDLLQAAGDAEWADVAALRTGTGTGDGNGNGNGTSGLMIEDFCRYRYVIYTEGVTYSGRLPFHQLCASVLLSPPVAWLMHTSHLVRPVFSSALPGVERAVRAGRGNGQFSPYPAKWVEKAWGRGVGVEEANMVFVAPDWTDLESVVAWLERHPKTAEGIARRQRETFHGGGYLSPAAEMCYWRAAIRGWNQVVRYEERDFEDLKAVPFEEFVLTQAQK